MRKTNNTNKKNSKREQTKRDNNKKKKKQTTTINRTINMTGRRRRHIICIRRNRTKQMVRWIQKSDTNNDTMKQRKTKKTKEDAP